MELRAFAEQVLFATSLEDKLRCPDNLTDDRPGAALTTPDAPGRPRELQFKPAVSGKQEFPGVHELEKERERGKLLHFFANHELLATELMALVLLRFPDAPAAFRKGVLQTLKDEQQHTRMYVARMKQCGIQFGELPVSGYFWRSVSGMENPMDYVSSLSLTFEQANLDFARHFSQGFATVGDDATAKLLDKIYRDEIGHVAYGLKWFRKWKHPGESDWDAFCRQLKFPLSPQRAKGITLNVEGRRAAGLDDQFIDQLNVYSQSKGRTPNVFVFNPFAEGRIAEGKTFNPTKVQAQLARDLANLPQFLCRQDDIVLVEKRPTIEFLSTIKQAGFALPEFVEQGRAGSPLPAVSEHTNAGAHGVTRPTSQTDQTTESPARKLPSLSSALSGGERSAGVSRPAARTLPDPLQSTPPSQREIPSLSSALSGEERSAGVSRPAARTLPDPLQSTPPSQREIPSLSSALSGEERSAGVSRPAARTLPDPLQSTLPSQREIPSLSSALSGGEGQGEEALGITQTGQSHLRSAGIKHLTTRKLGRLRPWAWGPDSVELFQPLFSQLTAEKRTAADSYNPGIAQLYSKAWSADLLRKVLSRSRRREEADILSRSSRGNEAPSKSEIRNPISQINSWLCTESEVGVVVDTVEAALTAITAIRARGHHRVVAKEAHGVAGHNALRFFEPEILPTQQRWLENVLRPGRQLIIEPWLDRLADFSVQLEMGPPGLKLCGYTGLVNDARGQFQANYAETHHHRRIPTSIVSLFPATENVSGNFLRLYAEIFDRLETELRRAHYLGPVGIDAFVYRAADGSVRLKPIVEINPRYTMGRVLVELMKQTAQGSCGVFRLVNRAQIKATGHEDFPAYAAALKKQHPLILAGESEPRIKSGALCLNDPTNVEVCLALFRAGPSVNELLKSL